MLLSPDKATQLLGAHHLMNRALLPVTLVSACTAGALDPQTWSYLAGANSLLFCAHSYYCCSSVISDYLRVPKVETVARVCNLKLHALALGGSWMLIKRYKQK